ncbi:MAG TPA: GGDEF domain-containing protein [Actinomycetota bacterium]|nr:GGDEF domain-containing protein [Actinomycetota bacterium]
MSRLSLKARALIVLGAVLIPAFLAIAAVQAGPKSLLLQYGAHVTASLAAKDLDAHLGDAHLLAAELLDAASGAETQQLTTQLLNQAVPAVDLGLQTMRGLQDDDPAAQQSALNTIAGAWLRFKTLWATQGLAPLTDAARAPELDQLDALFTPMEAGSESLAEAETTQAQTAYHRALRNYQSTVWVMRGLLLAGLALSAAVMLWLVRGILPRTAAYARFAERMADGDYSEAPEVKGNDEIGRLGHTLAAMAARQRTAGEYEATQLEFGDNLQMTENEEEAHDLLKRHLERSIPASTVTVLNRNNSADRLEAKTDVPAGSPLRTSLQGAEPRSCLAIRLSRRHTEGGAAPLLPCSVCSGCPGMSACTPLLVGGEVIGSVLVNGPQPLAEEQDRRIRETVTQSAPVLANLRNLAIAQLRAATDALTGLANRRAVDDTLKRMVAQSSRTLTPLSALLFDLDLFKQLNDTYGHGHGDEVLAAVGAALRATLRDSDFAGRYGGEEFLVLLPATGVDGAAVLADKIREAVAEIFVPSVERAITISVGVATIPDHAADADSLLRSADRALYAAKSGGRNRVEVAIPGGHAREEERAHPAA